MICILLAFPLFVKGVIVAVSDDDMVEEADAHQFAGPFDIPGQLLVWLTRFQVAGRMVVADSEDCAIG